jgi:hypothetical protein
LEFVMVAMLLLRGPLPSTIVQFPGGCRLLNPLPSTSPLLASEYYFINSMLNLSYERDDLA